MNKTARKFVPKPAPAENYGKQVAERVQFENAEKKLKETAIEEKLLFSLECIGASEFGNAMLYHMR